MKKQIGWVFVGIASLLWIFCLIVPFLSLSIAVKATSIAVAIVLAEVFFWLGALLIGKNIWQMLREKKRQQ